MDTITNTQYIVRPEDLTTRLPVGYFARPVTIDDVEAAVNLFNRYSRAINGTDQATVDGLRHEWESSSFNVETDTIAIFTEDGGMVAYNEFYATAPFVRYHTWALVDPAHQGIGLGKFLVAWMLERGRRSVEKAPADARVTLEQSINSIIEPAGRLLADSGMEMKRNFYTMQIDFDGAPQPPALPEGITIRPVENDDDLRLAVFGVYESFRDHWGYVEQPFEDFYKRWHDNLVTDPKFDRSLWFLAMAGETLAGISLCWINTDEEPDRGWVGSLGVLRPWRKHGLGLAMLQHSFVELNKRGKPRVGLGVDASSLTGATRLYERAGMRVVRKYDLYELELRPGRDYVTQTVEE